MSGFTTSDPIRQLLGILGDPASYKKQLSDYAAAREEADKATAKLNDTRQALEFEKAKHQASVEAHTARIADFESTKKRVLAAEQTLAGRESAVAKREADLTNQERVHAQAVSDWEKDYAAQKKELDKREKAVAAHESQLAELQLSLAAKEKSLATKLDRLRELAG